MSVATLGFADCNHFGGDEPSTRSLFQEHRKELAAVLATLFSVLAGLGLIFCADPKDLKDARSWAKQSWRESFCTVEDFGVSYRGNCETDVTITMTAYSDFAECLGPHHLPESPADVRDEWAVTPAGRCARRGDAAYAASSSGQLLSRRLTYRHERLVCHNSYLPWAVLRLENGSHGGGPSRCAYEFGAVRPSITGEWQDVLQVLSHLERARGVRGGIVCWALEADDCVVAFKDQHRLTRQERGERNLIRAHTTVCGVLAVLFGAFAACWQCQDTGLWLSPRGGRHMALPTSEPPQGPLLSERVQRIMDVAAQRLTETTPPVSGDSTLRISGAERSHRTVEVVLPNGNQTTVSQNIASDFIEVVR
mmetsp:Transcript_25199/g.50966  ORF Transcript_25199/g.50966 Transcript_25199/m.50966 type:complete len:365 (+) Transcript_25199:153-1247(+)